MLKTSGTSQQRRLQQRSTTMLATTGPQQHRNDNNSSRDTSHIRDRGRREGGGGGGIKRLYCLEYQNFCPVVCIGVTLPRKRVCLSRETLLLHSNTLTPQSLSFYLLIHTKSQEKIILDPFIALVSSSCQELYSL
jgi:hypothetical protein